MRILVTARYISGAAKDGGSSRFMRCVTDTLRAIGHEVTATTCPGEHLNDAFDLIICSHEKLDEVKNSPVKKVFISHGIIGDEAMRPGADRYIAVSDEVRDFNSYHGINSEVIGQPITIGRQTLPRPELKKILIIRRAAYTRENLFAFLSDKYEVRESDIDIPIENQIEWADLCITLGRGALESMAQGKPVLIADNREYIGAKGDGYVNASNIKEIARCNFSGRRFQHPLTREWIEAELAKYNPADSDILYQYVKDHHDARKIVNEYLAVRPDLKVSFGVMVNDWVRFGQVFQQSQITGETHFIKEPESATKGLNKLLDIIEGEGADIAILSHQDMHYNSFWLPQVREQLAKLPDNWMVSGIIGKDLEGKICGKFRDMRIPNYFDTSDIHEFPIAASCFDECCIIVNLKSGFRFNEELDGFDLYGSICCLQAAEMGGSAWIIGAYAEHYCLRPFTWRPDEQFCSNFKWLWEKYNKAGRVDTTAIGFVEDKNTVEE
jgi:hypothetical protein